jgi:N-acyl-D-aspartate/D-glutamate deacylase
VSGAVDAHPVTAGPFDLVVTGGTVVDGTGLPAYTADVAVRDGRVVRVGRVSRPERAAAGETIDADGLLVTPGFVDIHTHYDAQLHFEPTCSPASWHGVTTLLTGNCGFTLAPARPEDVPWLLQMLSRVEGMPSAALQAGVDFAGGGVGDLIAGLEGRIGVNAGFNVGHSAVRRMVMGEEAQERPATADEVAAMVELVRASMAAGAIGFTSSQLDLHQAHDGRPVPSNLAAPEEIVALAAVLAEFDHGSIEFIPRTFLVGYDDHDRALIRDMARASGRPVNLNTLTRMPNAPDGWRRSLEFAEECQREGLRVFPMFAANRQGVFFALGSTFLYDEMPTWRETLTLPEPSRSAALRDPSVRARLRTEFADPTGRAFVPRFDMVVCASVVDPAAHGDWVGRTIAALASERGQEPFDCYLDVSLEEGLDTVFTLAAPPSPERQATVAELIRHPLVMAGSSDGGAHLSSFVGADYPTRLLTEWVAGGVLSIEAAVARLSAIPAAVHGIWDRGVLRPGAWADLNVIDRSRLAAGTTRWVGDFPADSGRLVVDAEGYAATIVNGTVLHRDGKHTGALPGHIVRG